jgi:hypothetical protein
MKVIASLITSFTAVLAATQDSNPAVGSTNIVEVHSLSNCSKDTWLPVIAGDSWFTPETDAANQDHYEVTHPALPDDIILPDPLLPTDNATIKAVYALAIEHHDHAAKKTVGISSCGSRVYKLISWIRRRSIAANVRNECKIWIHSISCAAALMRGSSRALAKEQPGGPEHFSQKGTRENTRN